METMSENLGNYNEPESTLRKLDHDLKAIQQDPTASYWLKQAVTQLWERDVEDALNDLDVLRELLEAKHRADRLLFEKWAKDHDGTRH